MMKDGLGDSFEKSCGAIVYTIENGRIKYLLALLVKPLTLVVLLLLASK